MRVVMGRRRTEVVWRRRAESGRRGRIVVVRVGVVWSSVISRYPPAPTVPLVATAARRATTPGRAPFATHHPGAVGRFVHEPVFDDRDGDF